MEPLLITSRTNARIKHLKKLMADKEYRASCGEYVIEGRRVLDTVRSPLEIYVEENAEVPAIECRKTYRVAAQVFASLASTEHSQGVIVVARIAIKGPDALDPAARYILFDALQDPGNMGSIIRTACAFGIKGVILTPGCVDPFSPKVVRSAASGIEKIDIIRIAALSELEGCTLIGADMGGKALTGFAWPSSFILAIGSEAHGLSPETRRRVSSLISIPMPGAMESLNAAVAAGILLFAASVDPSAKDKIQ
ncbi:MAG: hypothetical protein A2293_17115 [Elusimicrobia bacterium RIFOXYB2_FULL_49_7]|nr:MAG: hypothetical protein A2293_17115 [Elusimicrobia bacterium RIFOXYB2_FULL_49_7]